MNEIVELKEMMRELYCEVENLSEEVSNFRKEIKYKEPKVKCCPICKGTGKVKQ